MINSDGVFTAGDAAGDFLDNVTASLTIDSRDLVATASVVVEPGSLSTVSVVPNAVGLGIGATHQFAFIAKDGFGNVITDALSSWTVSPGAGSIADSGVITAGSTAGFYVDGVRVDLVRQSARASATADVSIEPDPLANIRLSPLHTSLLEGASQDFDATAFDQYDNPISGLQFLWKTSGGRITQSGIYTAASGFSDNTVTASASFKNVSRTGTANVRAGGKPGGHIRMSAYADLQSWDPIGSSSLSSVNAYSQLYNQLVQFDTVSTDRVVCDLCESWTVSPSGQTYTFKLREGIKWLDGNDLTAEDVVFSMERYMRSDPIGRSGLFRNYLLSPEQGGVKYIDPLTLEFKLEVPSAAFLKYLASDYTKILPKHLLDIGVNLSDPEVVIATNSGSGPFVLDEYERGNFYKVSKNLNYFKSGRPFFDSIDHFIVTDTATLIALFKIGQIDMTNGGFTNITPAQAADIESSTKGGFIPVTIPGGTNWGLMMNVKKAPFNDSRVREAIQLAIDYQRLNELVFDGASTGVCPLMGLAHSFEECSKWPGLRSKDGPGGAQDIARAKTLMTEAGFPDGFTTKYDVRQVGSYPDQCTVVQEMLKNTLGIEGDLAIHRSSVGYALFDTSRRTGAVGDWELACQGQGQVILDVDEVVGGTYVQGAARNYTDWSNDRVDTWFRQQKSELNPVTRKAINKELETFLFTQQDNHWIQIATGGLQWLISKDIQGFNAPQGIQSHFKHEDLWLDR